MSESKDSRYSGALNRTEDDEDYEVIPTTKNVPTSPTTKPAGMAELNLSFAAADKKRDVPSIQERDILVIFDLPDGSQGERYFKLGQTVEVLKSYVESEFGIPMNSQKLFLDDKPMMDPLSLLDFPEAKGMNEMYVRVDGSLPSESKK